MRNQIIRFRVKEKGQQAGWLQGRSIAEVFGRQWEKEKDEIEREKTDKLGDDKVQSCLLGLMCTVQHEQYKIGALRVRSMPSAAAFSNFPGVVEHGHAACCDLKVDSTADLATLRWEFGSNVFVGKDGEDLRHFEGAVQYWKTTGNDVYVYHQVLRRQTARS